MRSEKLVRSPAHPLTCFVAGEGGRARRQEADQLLENRSQAVAQYNVDQATYVRESSKQGVPVCGATALDKETDSQRRREAHNER